MGCATGVGAGLEQGPGSRLLSRVMWKGGGFGWMRAALRGRGLGIACEKGRTGVRWLWCGVPVVAAW